MLQAPTCFTSPHYLVLQELLPGLCGLRKVPETGGEESGRHTS